MSSSLPDLLVGSGSSSLLAIGWFSFSLAADGSSLEIASITNADEEETESGTWSIATEAAWPLIGFSSIMPNSRTLAEAFSFADASALSSCFVGSSEMSIETRVSFSIGTSSAVFFVNIGWVIAAVLTRFFWVNWL